MPPNPMALTPARKGKSAGQASALGSTFSAGVSPVSSLCCSIVPVAGGKICWCKAIVALISPAMPAAALVWPILPLIEPITAGDTLESEAAACRARDKVRSSTASPTAVPVPCPSI